MCLRRAIVLKNVCKKTRPENSWVRVLGSWVITLQIFKKLIVVVWHPEFGKKKAFSLLDSSPVQESFAVSTKLYYCVLN